MLGLLKQCFLPICSVKNENLYNNPNISEILNKVGGIDTLKNMLNTDLGKINEEVEKSKKVVEKIIDKKDNGKPKKRTNKKNKM
jgi:hypothetical protein